MFWSALYESSLTPHITEFDVSVFKIGIPSTNPNIFKGLRDEHMYIKNKRMPKISIKADYVILDGYHSYDSITEALCEDYFNESITSIGEFIIPKNTTYYCDRHNIVSESIIFKRYLKVKSFTKNNQNYLEVINER